MFCKFPVNFRNYIIRFEELILFLSLESGYRKHLSEFPAFRNSAVRSSGKAGRFALLQSGLHYGSATFRSRAADASAFVYEFSSPAEL